MSDTQYLERRNFFRVDDHAIIDCKPISAQEKQEGVERLKSHALELPDVSRLFLSLESSLQDHILKIKDTNLQQSLHLLNRKMNLLAHGGVVNETYQTIMTRTSQPIVLSASGVGFVSDKPWQIDDFCTVELVLLPNKTYMFGYAKIEHCERIEENTSESAYRVGLSYEYLREEDMERLIAHIMRVEAQLIRDSKQTK